MNFDIVQWYLFIGAIVGTFSVFILQKEFTTGTGVIGMLGRMALAFLGWPAWMWIARTRLTAVRELVNMPTIRVAIDKALSPNGIASTSTYDLEDAKIDLQFQEASNDFLSALTQELESLDAKGFKEIVTHKMSIRFDEDIQSWVVSSGKYTRSAPELGMAVELLSFAVSDAK